jgi:hypothetical protein
VTQNLAGKLAPVLSSGLTAATNGDEASFVLCRAFALGVEALFALLTDARLVFSCKIIIVKRNGRAFDFDVF